MVTVGGNRNHFFLLIKEPSESQRNLYYIEPQRHLIVDISRTHLHVDEEFISSSQVLFFFLPTLKICDVWCYATSKWSNKPHQQTINMPLDHFF